MNVSPVLQTPYERGGIITPGLPILPHGVERHPVPGGGSRAVSIDRGDEMGGQVHRIDFAALNGSAQITGGHSGPVF